LHEQSTVFDGLAAFMGGYSEGSNVMVGNSAEFAGVTRTTEDFFHVMGVDAAIGRLFTHEEQQPGAPMVAVIGDAFWKRRFNGDPHAIGRTLRAYGRPFTIMGVMPPGFTFPGKTDVWVARPIEEKLPSRTAMNWRLIARLKPGVSVAQAQEELNAISARLA